MTEHPNPSPKRPLLHGWLWHILILLVALLMLSSMVYTIFVLFSALLSSGAR